MHKKKVPQFDDEIYNCHTTTDNYEVKMIVIGLIILINCSMSSQKD